MRLNEIIKRMESGERLRYISREIAGKKCKPEYKGIRDLYLGKDELDSDSSYEVEIGISKGLIRRFPYTRRSHVINFELMF